MKLLLFLFFELVLISCHKSNYEGYLYDTINRKPISGVQVSDLVSGDKTVTNEKGYFILQKRDDISSSLIFHKEQYYKNTICSIQIQNGEKQKELFKGDAIFILKNEVKDSILKINGAVIY